MKRMVSFLRALRTHIASMSNAEIKVLTVTFTAGVIGLLFLIALLAKFDINRKLIASSPFWKLLNRTEQQERLVENITMDDVEDQGAEEEEPENLDLQVDTDVAVVSDTPEIVLQSTQAVQYLEKQSEIEDVAEKVDADRTEADVADVGDLFTENGSSTASAELSGGGGALVVAPVGGGEISQERGTGNADGLNSNRGSAGRGGSGSVGDGMGSMSSFICNNEDMDLVLDPQLSDKLNHRRGQCLIRDTWTDRQGKVWTLFMTSNPGTNTVSLAAIEEIADDGRTCALKVLILKFDRGLKRMKKTDYQVGTVQIFSGLWMIDTVTKPLQQAGELGTLVEDWWTKKDQGAGR
jgi:hypothetical protein